MASFLTCCCSQFPVWLRTFKSICMFIAQGLLLHVVCMHADKLYVKDFLAFQVKFWLAKKGFMKQFEGSWKIQPFYIDAEGGPALEDNANRVASIVFLQQVHNLLSPTTETSGIFDDAPTVSLMMIKQYLFDGDRGVFNTGIATSTGATATDQRLCTWHYCKGN